MLTSRVRSLLLLVCACISPALYAYDIAHFYRASYLNLEPRLERAWLGSFDAGWAGGQTRKSKNAHGSTVPLLDIYGDYNMRLLATGVENLNPSNSLDAILLALANLPQRQKFGHLSFDGLFEIFEGYLYFTQNFNHGFFAQLHVPVRAMRISSISYTDLSPQDDTFPNYKTPEWQDFLRNFSAILKRYNVRRNDVKNDGIGDTSVMVGWTINYEETKKIDFIDFTIKSGVLIPTGIPRNSKEVFSLPNGYNGHVGLPLSADLAIGAYEWLNAGLHGDILVFLSRKTNLLLKTDSEQSGLIKLAHGQAVVDQGALWTITAYLKADHVFRGLSFTLGYTYNRSNGSHLAPVDATQFDAAIINTDQQFKPWDQHIINIAMEYDFTQPEANKGARMGLFYNVPFRGERIFDTTLGGGNVGVEVLWDF